jgi:hypothetical protein
MGIEEKLASLCDVADKSMTAVNSNTRQLFQLLADDAKKFKFSYDARHQVLIDEILQNGLISDSASFILDTILDSDRAKLADLVLGPDRSRATLKPKISEFLREMNGNDRGFVYVAWKARPEEYHYVGKAGSSARMNLDAHGKLLEALKSASTLSFIFPAISKANTISNLEAAMMHLIEFKTGSLPTENDKKESSHLDYECGEELTQIRKLISQIHRQL